MQVLTSSCHFAVRIRETRAYWRSVVASRKCEAKYGSAARSIFEPNLSVVGRDDRPANSEAQSDASRGAPVAVAAVQALEDLLFFARRNARTPIRHVDDDSGMFASHGDVDGCAR